MKKAYTLSEVLVVMGVLGLIAAFIIPAVLKTAPDRTALLYKKTFFATQEAAKKLIADSSLYYVVENNNNHKGLFTDEGGVNFCKNFANKMNVTGTVKCGSDPNFTTTNGVEWSGFGGNFTGEYKDVSVTCNSCTYKIRIYKDGRVGTDDTWTNPPANCDKSENGILGHPFTYKKGPIGED